MAEVKTLQTAKTQERGVVKYVAADGQEVTLTPDVVKKYLVQGNGEKVTMQELMYFLNICRARRLNPLTKDCYLIKYGEDPAAIVTSIDYFRKRARAQKDCRGWKKGVIVVGKDGKPHDSHGLVLEGEKLVGGWFEATPEGWLHPFRLEVNLSGYVKKTKDGRVTKFWSEDNQPSQIAKVAESQGLRLLWPDEFQQIHSDAEIATEELKDLPGTIDVTTDSNIDLNFKAVVEGLDAVMMAKYLEVCAAHFKKSVDEIKAGAVEKPDAFKEAFGKWKAQQDKKAQASQENGKKEEPEEDLTVMSGDCPNSPGNQYMKGFCKPSCKEYEGCPAWKESK